MERDNLSFYKRALRHETISIVGIPLELGSDERGLAEAPRHMLDSGLEKMLASLGATVSGIQMIPCPARLPAHGAGPAKYLEEIASIARRSSAAVVGAAERGDFVVALGGDHSAAIGTIAGASCAYPSLGVIWIDAHPDVNTHETTQSGNVHGMVAAARMGFGHPLLTDISAAPPIAPEYFLPIGIKDMDQSEIEFLRRERIKAITMLDIAAHGLARAIHAIDSLRHSVDAVWVSMDMDSIDEAFAPGVGLATEGGLTRREVLALTQYIGATCPIIGLDVVEMLPAKDREGKTIALALELIARFLGSEHSWYRSYMDSYAKANITSEEVLEHGAA